MQAFAQKLVSLQPAAKLACAVLGIVIIHTVFRLLERKLPLHFRRQDARYRARKFVVFAGYIVALTFIAVLFEDRLGRVGVALGIAAAGLVVALQDLIASMAGWLAIAWSNLYKVGDRVQIGEIRGDVIDVSFTRTEVVETGSWVGNDLYNGRVVRIPNSVALKSPIFNYSQGFRFLWDEVKIQLTPDSDHVLARNVLLGIATEAVAGYRMEAEISWKRVTDNFRMEDVSLNPTVSLIVRNGMLEFTLSYIVDYTNRTSMQDRLFAEMVQAVHESNGKLIWAKE